jgi:polyisoprenyl-phosphate glycosyltransferase
MVKSPKPHACAGPDQPDRVYLELRSTSLTSDDQSAGKPTLSIVVPAHNEHGNLQRLHAELSTAISPLVASWELVLVDDGSTDSTWEDIAALHEQDNRVYGVRLSRNFGHQNALIAGMALARGDAVVTMDADLQHPPDVVPALIAEWRRGNKIVKTVRRDPPNLPMLKRLTSRLFYRLFSYLSGVEMHSGMADFRLVDRGVLRQILAFKEEGLFLRGIVQWVGYRSSTVEFDCGERFSGKTNYTMRRMVRLAWHGISSFSLVPLRIGILMGLSASTLAFLGVVYAMVLRWREGVAIAGWASSVAILSFLFAVLFLFLAVLAEYIGRILEEVRGRPRFIVSDKLLPTSDASPPTPDDR